MNKRAGMGKELTKDMLPVGKEIPWDLCNRQGRVMFRKGFVVNTPASCERILGMKLQVSAESDGTVKDSGPELSLAAALQAHTVVGPLRVIESLADQVTELFAGICYGPLPDLSALYSLVESADRLFAEHPDTCLAAVHFNHGRSYQSLHAIYSLFLATQFAEVLAYDKTGSRSLASAALTANLGMFEYHDEWANQPGPLTDEQNQVRLQHPNRSAERLQSLGVNDPFWLQTVRQHHEFRDGSGYPLGLGGDDVLESARVVGLIDCYLAGVLPRAGRTPDSGKALKRVYQHAGKYGEQLARLMVKVIGVYPPGTSVELENGEIAVVIHRDMDDTARPSVITVKQQDDRYSKDQPVRDTGENRYRIVGVYTPVKGEVNPALMVRAWH
ncbi:MAG: HD-GYP domain-containing protein [Thiogranum sp.]